MGRTVSNAPGYAPVEEFDPRIDDFVAKDRKYLHFDLPLSDDERESFSVSAEEICKNSFWPLIGYTTEERRVRKEKSGKLQFSTKERAIKFGSHRDAALFEFYANSLSHDYEKYLKSAGLTDSILAYRSGVGNNINHAKALFDEIRARGNCAAIAMDIKGFFDHIRHSVLYDALLVTRSTGRLSKADFTIFERMTHFEWAESDDLRSRLGEKYGRFGRICSSHDFRTDVRGRKPSLVKQNPHDFGIPQGTPLSGLYANISLQSFDEASSQALAKIGGSYRRYSDDIAIVIPNASDVDGTIASVASQLGALGLALSDSKTEVSEFSLTDKKQTADRPFQYLGFTFDGRKTLIRQSSLNRYYSKMSRGIRAKVRAAKKKNVPKDEIYMRELFRKYTHFGRGRNFPRYAYRAAFVHQAQEIRNQLRGHMTAFKKIVTNAVDTIY